MSDYHILEGALEGGGENYKVVFHIPVPSENNEVGYDLQLALSEDTEITKNSKVSWIAGAEQTSLDAGELFEYEEVYTRNTNNTLGEDRDALDARFGTLSIGVVNRLRDRYKYWHYDRDVA